MTEFGIDGNSGDQICRIVQLSRHGHVSMFNFFADDAPALPSIVVPLGIVMVLIVYPLRMQSLDDSPEQRQAIASCFKYLTTSYRVVQMRSPAAV